MDNVSGFPTVLVAEEDDRLRAALVRKLQADGYLVLQAEDTVDALEIVRTHSRPIQLLLIAAGVENRTLAETIKQYRHGIAVIFVSYEAEEIQPDSLPPELFLEKARQILQPRAGNAAETKQTTPSLVRYMKQSA